MAKSTQLLQRHFERLSRDNLGGERHRFSALPGVISHDEQVSQQGPLEMFASFASSGPLLYLLLVSQVRRLFALSEGKAIPC